MNENRKLPLSGFALKLIAILLMLVDHIGLFLSMYAGKAANVEAAETASEIMRYIGRLSFPIFALLLAEGMRYSHNRGRYLLRLLGLYGLVTGVQLILAYTPNGLISGLDAVPSPITDLLFSALVLFCLLLKGAKKLYALLPIGFYLLCYGVGAYEVAKDVTVVWLPRLLRPAYSLFGLLTVLGFYCAFPLAYKMSKGMCQSLGISEEIFPETYQGRRLINILGCLFFFASTAAFWGLSYVGNGFLDPVYNPLQPEITMSIQTYCLLAILFIYFYSGKRGYDSKKWRIASYSFFPVHIAVLYVVFYLIFM